MEKLPSKITSEAETGRRASLSALFRVFLTVGAISFGGGVVGYMREYLVRGEGWLSDDDFFDALEVSETLPGLNSVNLSVIVGDRMRGALGAAVAAGAIILPGAIVVLVLGALWESQRHNQHLKFFLTGVAAAAAGMLLTVTLQLGRRQFSRPADLLLIAATFTAVSLLNLSLGVVLVVMGSLAVWYYRPQTGRADLATPHFERTAHRGRLRH